MDVGFPMLKKEGEVLRPVASRFWGRAAALAGACCLACLLSACEDGSGGDIVPDADPTAPLAIVSPAEGARVQGDVLELTGVGMRDVASVTVRVHTDQWYVQDGTLRTSANQSWAYAPVYVSGQGRYNNHRIEVVVTHPDGSRDAASVENVVRQ